MRTSPNYKLKADVLKTDLPKKVNKLRKKQYEMWKYIDESFDQIRKDIDDEYCSLVLSYGYEEYKEAIRINNANWQRFKRICQRVSLYLHFPCVFLTLTFKDEVLNGTTEKTRRKYVSRFLRELSNHYVANIDYGKDDRYTHREHYHALVLGKIRKKDLSYWSENIGFTHIRTVKRRNSENAVAMYISKLTNHAIKDSTRRHVYIYSRDKEGIFI